MKKIVKKSFEVNVTTLYGLNIRMLNKSNKRECYFNYFVSLAEVEFFADNLKGVIDICLFENHGKCMHCGEPCTTTQELFKINGDKFLHCECSNEALKQMRIPDVIKCTYIEPSPDAEISYCVSTLDSNNKWFTYSIQAAAARNEIHITVRGNTQSITCKRSAERVGLVDK